MSDTIDEETGLSWKQRAEMADEAIAEARRAGFFTGQTVLRYYEIGLDQRRRFQAAGPDMPEAKRRIEANLRETGRTSYGLDEILPMAERIDFERNYPEFASIVPKPPRATLGESIRSFFGRLSWIN